MSVAALSDPQSWTTRNRDDRPIPIDRLRQLTRRSTARGVLRLGCHITLLAAGSGLIAVATGAWLLPAMLLQGMLIAALFAPMHESVHYTSVESRRLAEWIAWFAALPNLYNATHYRLFHKAHHRYTQDPERDPELMVAKPQSLLDYAVRITGLTFWHLRAKFLIDCARGQFQGMSYLAPTDRTAVRRSVGVQLALYGGVAVGSLWYGTAIPLLYWVIPALMGRPFLAAMLLSEHTGCSEEPDGLANTRSTETLALWRWVLWNMPYHAEHHFYPSIPFHALPAAHEIMRPRLGHAAPGYVRTHLGFIKRLAQGTPL
jgi:fatty acid desaturase